MKVLVFGLNWVGDVVMSFTALSNAALGAKARVDVVTRPSLAPLYGVHAGVGRVHALETRRPFWELLSDLLRLRRAEYDLIIVLPRSFRSAWLAFLAGGRRRVGFRGEGRGFLFHQAESLPAELTTLHESRLYDRLVAAAGLADFAAPLPTVSLPAEEVEAVRRKFDLGDGRPFCMLAPGAAFGPAKRWAADRFGEVGREAFLRWGLDVVATGTTGEAVLTAAASGPAGIRGHDLAGRTSLRELLALLSEAEFLVTNDSGTMHLGALMKTPLLVAAGATDLTRTGPMAERFRLVRGEGCSPPCRRRVCPRGDHRCLDSVTVPQMLSEAELLLALGRRHGGGHG